MREKGGCFSTRFFGRYAPHVSRLSTIPSQEEKKDNRRDGHHNQLKRKLEHHSVSKHNNNITTYRHSPHRQIPQQNHTQRTTPERPPPRRLLRQSKLRRKPRRGAHSQEFQNHRFVVFEFFTLEHVEAGVAVAGEESVGDPDGVVDALEV